MGLTCDDLDALADQDIESGSPQPRDDSGVLRSFRVETMDADMGPHADVSLPPVDGVVISREVSNIEYTILAPAAAPRVVGTGSAARSDWQSSQPSSASSARNQSLRFSRFGAGGSSVTLKLYAP